MFSKDLQYVSCPKIYWYHNKTFYWVKYFESFIKKRCVSNCLKNLFISWSSNVSFMNNFSRGGPPTAHPNQSNFCPPLKYWSLYNVYGSLYLCLFRGDFGLFFNSRFRYCTGCECGLVKLVSSNKFLSSYPPN